ncbi:MAG TPA: secretin N-terminal domain-containing protein [Pirellulales bacterium]|nr:secretin N-terminal domain-containing protein [Pirellulales bacterium]
MKCTLSSVAMLAVFMYGLMCAAFLYGQAEAPSTPAVPPPPSAAGASQGRRAPHATAIVTPGAPAATSVTTPGSPDAITGVIVSGTPDSIPITVRSNGMVTPEGEKQELRLFKLSNADASAIVPELATLFAGLTLVPDARTNTLIVQGTPEVLAKVEKVIQQLDAPQAQSGTVSNKSAHGKAAVSSASAGSQSENPQMKSGTGGGGGIGDGFFGGGGSAGGTGGGVWQFAPPEGATDAAATFINNGRFDQAQQAAEQTRQFKQLMDNLSQLKAVMKGDDLATLQRAAEAMKRANEEAQRANEDARRATEVLNRIEATARMIRGEEEDTDPTPQRKAALERDQDTLKKLLDSQFDDQQKRESDELQQLRQRLDKLEKEINDRAANRDNIIKGRLKELTSSAAATPSLQPVTIFTSPSLTLENGSGSVPVQIETKTPGTITITRPAPTEPASADSAPADDAK